MTTLFKLSAAAASTAALCLCAASQAQPQAQAPLKVGLMLPATGTFASLGTMIENGFKLYVQEHGGKLAGREIQYFKVDDESDPSMASATPECTVPTSTSTLSRLISLLTLSVAFDGSDSSSTLKY